MHWSLRSLFISVLAAAAITVAAGPAHATSFIVLQTGGNAVNQPDPNITFLGLGSCCAEFPVFTPAHFVGAAGGPNAWVIGQAHGAWNPSLVCPSTPNPPPTWIGAQLNGAPETALFAQAFNINEACIDKATLEFCWLTDDVLGGQVNNLAGVYLNMNPVTPNITGGNYASPTSVSGVDVTALVQSGQNYLYTYNVDVGSAVSGVNYVAILRVDECFLPVQPSTWSDLKSRYN